MKKLAWITNGLTAASVVVSAATPDMWGNGTAILLAGSAFAIGAANSLDTEKQAASQEEITTTIHDYLDALRHDLARQGDAGNVRFDDLETQLQVTADIVGHRLDELDKHVGGMDNRLRELEKLAESQGGQNAELQKLIADGANAITLIKNQIINNVQFRDNIETQINYINPAPQMPPASVMPGLLPSKPGIIIGREDALKELKKRLGIGEGSKLHDSVQVLTAVHGWPGVGKTTIAAALAHDPDVAKAFPDGVLWASLGTSPNILSELAKWGRALGVQNLDQAQDADEASKIIAAHLRDKRMLLIIDDAWNADDAELLRVGGKDCATLVTTRQPDTASAIAPNAGAVYNLDVLCKEHAIELLTELAPRVVEKHPDESLVLVNELGRLPIAIQIAGRMLNAQTRYNSGVAKLLEDLRKGTALLEGKAPTDRMDPQTGITPILAVLLETSVQELEPEIQEHFKYLGAFVAKPVSFDAAALAALWQVKDPLPNIYKLVDRGLIEPAEAEGRYMIHAVMQMYAGHIAKGNQAGLRHAGYYAALADKADELYEKGGENVIQGLMMFDLERGNIEAGQKWAAENSKTDKKAALLCIEYPLGCSGILFLRLHPREMVKWLEVALEAAQKLENMQIEGNVLGNFGNAYLRLGAYRRATESYEKALNIFQVVGDRMAEGMALGNLGSVYTLLGEHSHAIEIFERRIEIAIAVGDLRGQGSALGNLGVIYGSLGDSRRAIEYFKRLLEIAKKTGNRYNEAATLGNLGVAYGSLGDYRRAIELHEKRLEIALEIGDRLGEGNALGNLGNAYDFLGDYRCAIEFYGKSLEIKREIGDRRGEGNALWNWSLSLYKLGERDKAIPLAQEALGILEQIESPDAAGVREALAEWQGGSSSVL